MTRPNTGQPATDDELTTATQNANASLSEKLASGEITRGFEDDDKSDEEKVADVREFRENIREQGNDELGVYGDPQTDDETELVVTEDGETTTYTRDEWENTRGARTQTWNRLERNGGVFVRVKHWFDDADVNKVTTGRGFYAEQTDETEKAVQFKVSADGGNHNAGTETVWVPKKAVQVYELV